MQAAAGLGCLICQHLGLGATPAELHHPREKTGMAMRAAHTSVIPLCPEHHRGKTGIHGLGRKAFEQRYGITERELVERTRELIEERKRFIASGNA